jgi:hypothetical protein
MTEGKLDVALFVDLGRACPALEEVEIEVCGYPTFNEDVGFEWVRFFVFLLAEGYWPF